MKRLRHLRIVVWALIVVGVGLAQGVAPAQFKVAGPLAAIAAEDPTTAPNPKNDTARVSCVAQAPCSVFAGPVNGHFGVSGEKSAGIPGDIEVRSGLAITPTSPPPKSISRA